MNAKAYLLQIRVLDRKIKVLTDEIGKYEAMATKMTPSMEKMNVQTSVKNTHEEATIEYIIATEELAKLLREYSSKRNEIIGNIVRLSDADQIELLYQRYCQLYTWETIEQNMGYSRTWVFETHGKALQELKKLINKKVD